MKVVLPNGVIAESSNPVVTEQWKKAGYQEIKPVEVVRLEKKTARKKTKKS